MDNAIDKINSPVPRLGKDHVVWSIEAIPIFDERQFDQGHEVNVVDKYAARS